MQGDSKVSGQANGKTELPFSDRRMNTEDTSELEHQQ